MKRSALLCMLLVCALLLSACSSLSTPAVTDPAQEPAAVLQPAESAEPSPETTEAPAQTETSPAETTRIPEPENTESLAFSERFPHMDEAILGVIYNDPFAYGTPDETEVWNYEPYDRVAIIPRYPGSSVEAFRLSYDDNGEKFELSTDSRYTTTAEDGCVILAGLTRPDVMPLWAVSITAPDGRSALMTLAYNGRYGTPSYEFLVDDAVSRDWELQADEYGAFAVSAFLRAADRQGLDPADAAKACWSALTELGDSAAFTLCEGDMDSGVYHLETARFHENYYEECDTLAESVAAQYSRYASEGNARGILGPDTNSDGVELEFQLTGLTVFNPSMAASKVRICVNGTEAGVFDLCASDLCTLIPLELPSVRADAPITVDVEVLETNYGAPVDAILEVYPGVGGNISGAR